jgi:hypothetical protein
LVFVSILKILWQYVLHDLLSEFVDKQFISIFAYYLVKILQHFGSILKLRSSPFCVYKLIPLCASKTCFSFCFSSSQP